MLTKTEGQRILALKEYGILDTLPEKDYDSIATIASQICQTPVAHISFIDSTRQWFKSTIGFDVTEVPKEIAFCTYLINNPDSEILLVNDSKKDDRFCNNPLTEIETPVIFCASVPIKNDAGQVLGSLCVIDHRPRRISPQQIQSLYFLAASILDKIEKKKAQEALQKRQQQLSEAEQIAKLTSFEWQPGIGKIEWSKSVHSTLGIDSADTIKNFEDVFKYIHPDDRQIVLASSEKLPSNKKEENLQFRLVTTSGQIKYVEVKRKLSTLPGLPPTIFGTIQDITEQKMVERKIFDAIIESEEKERSRIAGELHDGVCQHLGAALLTIKTAVVFLESDEKLAKQLFKQSKDIVREALELTRRVSHELAPSQIQEGGLCEAIRIMIENLNGIDKIKYILNKKGKNKLLDQTVSINLLRIVQEFIRNSQKHSEAKEVIISMNYKKKVLELCVCDDGKGFDSGKIKKNGIGIFNMIKRIETIGGSYNYISAPKKGVKLNIQIPTS